MAIHRDKFKTFKDVFDLFTEKNLFKLISQGYFDALESPISVGKEANIFTALRNDGTRVVVKIYRLSTCDFNKMYQYMTEDPRFVSLKHNRRDIIFTWAHREQLNLLKARAAGVNVPTPLGVLKNILIIDCIGRDDPAPKLKDKPPQRPVHFLNSIVENYRKLYHRARLVHGDLSPYNILNDNDHPVFIDLSQATVLENLHAETYLKRDMKNLATYFNKQGIAIETEELVSRVINDQ